MGAALLLMLADLYDNAGRNIQQFLPYAVCSSNLPEKIPAVRGQRKLSESCKDARDAFDRFVSTCRLKSENITETKGVGTNQCMIIYSFTRLINKIQEAVDISFSGFEDP
jgi:hypothetical protein